MEKDLNPVRSKKPEISADLLNANQTSNGMKVLMIGTDRKLFEEGSAVAERIREYGRLVGELHIVVLATQKHLRLLKIHPRELQIAPNVWVYPTRSLSRWFYIGDAIRLGKKIVRKRNFIRSKSLITTQDPFECGYAGLRIKKRFHLPLEVQLHTDPFSHYFSGFLNTVRKIIAKRVVTRADGVRVVSEALRKKIEHLTDARVRVLPIYVDKRAVDEWRPAFDLHERYPWKFILLAVARLSPEKNLGATIKTLKLVQRKFPDTGLVIVGDGPEKWKLKLLAKRLNLDDSVAFAGFQSDPFSFYKTANAFIQTSSYEGYGMSFVEAGLAGLPIISTKVGLAKEFVHGEDALLYDKADPEDFALGVMDLIRNNFKRDSLKINMRRTLETKLISKEEYLKKMEENWLEVSRNVK